MGKLISGHVKNGEQREAGHRQQMTAGQDLQSSVVTCSAHLAIWLSESLSSVSSPKSWF
jgi:hypothetical protein